MDQSPMTSTPNNTTVASDVGLHNQEQSSYMQFESDLGHRHVAYKNKATDHDGENLSRPRVISELPFGCISKNNNNYSASSNNNGKLNHFDSPSSPQSSNSSQTQNDEFSPNLLSRNPNSSPASPLSSYNSSFGSNSGKKLMLNNTSGGSITSQVPGGVVTTQNISTVIRPRSNNNSLQFVKIQTPELSKKAVEQIRIVEETKMSREKIKEVEEEWQNNLLNWKSKRRQQFAHTVSSNNEFSLGNYNNDDINEPGGGRKIKTFAKMIEERAKSGNRLGFHLQRYIGDGDEDESPITALAANADGDIHSIEDKNFSNQSQVDHPARSRSDSTDGEALSSTSSGYNRLDSKSSSSPDTLFETPRTINNHDRIDHNVRHYNPNCDNVSEEQDSSNVSGRDVTKTTISHLADDFDTLNLSKARDLTTQVTFNGHNGSVMMTESEMKAARSSTIVDPPESDNSCYEEDDDEEKDEEEEEQKHLQRIAFEAKLKAFEKLTKPTRAEAPKVTSARPIVKHPKPILSRSPNSSTTTNIEVSRVQTSNTNSQVKLSPVDSLASRESSTQRPSNTLASNERVHDFPEQQMNQFDNHLNYQKQRRQQHQTHSAPKEEMSMPPQPPAQLSAPLPHIQQPIPQKLVPQQQQQTDQHFHQAPPPPMQPTLSDHRKSGSKDDKDKNILSVSGRKRCSSCREELGRGAAAFVVESLSLVYHTNCFRCSVCHVNLSNGFRGVDVRVHAGALHCQNCYSKDGLNYSRV